MNVERKATIYYSQGATLEKNDDNNKIKREEPKGDEYIVSPCLRQKVENL